MMEAAGKKEGKGSRKKKSGRKRGGEKGKKMEVKRMRRGKVSAVTWGCPEIMQSQLFDDEPRPPSPSPGPEWAPPAADGEAHSPDGTPASFGPHTQLNNSLIICQC